MPGPLATPEPAGPHGPAGPLGPGQPPYTPPAYVPPQRRTEIISDEQLMEMLHRYRHQWSAEDFLWLMTYLEPVIWRALARFGVWRCPKDEWTLLREFDATIGVWMARQKDKRAQVVVLAALPNGVAYVGTSAAFEETVKAYDRARAMRTITNISGGFAGAAGYLWGGDLGSDIGAVVDGGAQGVQATVNARRFNHAATNTAPGKPVAAIIDQPRGAGGRGVTGTPGAGGSGAAGPGGRGVTSTPGTLNRVDLPKLPKSLPKFPNSQPNPAKSPATPPGRGFVAPANPYAPGRIAGPPTRPAVPSAGRGTAATGVPPRGTTASTPAPSGPGTGGPAVGSRGTGPTTAGPGGGGPVVGSRGTGPTTPPRPPWAGPPAPAPPAAAPAAPATAPPARKPARKRGAGQPPDLAERRADAIIASYNGRLVDPGRALDETLRRTGAVDANIKLMRAASVELSLIDYLLGPNFRGPMGVDAAGRPVRLTVARVILHRPVSGGGRISDLSIEFSDGSRTQLEISAVTSAPGRGAAAKATGTRLVALTVERLADLGTLKDRLRDKTVPGRKPLQLSRAATADDRPGGMVAIAVVQPGRDGEAMCRKALKDLQPVLDPFVEGVIFSFWPPVKAGEPARRKFIILDRQPNGEYTDRP